MPKTNIVAMPQRDEPAPSADLLGPEFMEALMFISSRIQEACTVAMQNVRNAELQCLSRLNEYVPTERPLTLDEAAAYLRMSPRTLDEGTRPGRAPVVGFIPMGGKKLFLKATLDAHLVRHEVKSTEVKL